MESVLSQGYNDFEYIVIDGGSTDGTIDIIRRYEDRIAHWISEPDRGIYDAWNKGLRLARGEWIAFLGSDDAYYPDALEEYANFIEKADSQLDYISSCVNLVNKDMRKVKIICEPWTWQKFRKRMKIAHVGSMHNKRLYERYGLYDTSYRITGDYEFLLRAGQGLKAGFLDAVTAMMRMDGVSQNVMAAFEEAQRAKVITGKRNKLVSSIESVVEISKTIIKRKLS